MIAYRIKQLAKPNGPISRSKIFADIADGRLTAHKVGGATIIIHSDWVHYLTSECRPPTEAAKGPRLSVRR